ncbi:MAG: phosphatidylinositol phosphate synthase [Candidatus Nanopelagicales bacterium]|jgi:CDP-diacylglycerol--glycerol-3-phosphate 3-phosphatidyltransferase
MLSKTKAKNISTAIAHPFAVLFIKLRISADVITFIGTLGVCLTSVIYFSRGQFLIGSLLFTFFVGFDALDGTMARMLNKKSKWGAFFDSVMDRIADGVVLASISYYFLIQQENLLFIVSLVALISSEIVSYTKARAEGLGLTCDTGIAERPERVIIIIFGTFLTGLGLSMAIQWSIWILAVVSLITVLQRMNFVYKQVK